ncbi:trigger factor [Pseudanabaena sp. PCC 6802]|uniref:trigger factor n=1 Tax=Pseudanabaena sp. PCC 6802 TaxID=118173 RepID=UPI0003495706|nr:trigger factor [Pseudanabaena sp. PCC 6802]
MKVTLEKLPKSQVCFDIEVEGEKSQAIYDRTVQKLTRSVQVPGFRKGKAPKQLVMRQIGTEQIKAGVLEDLLEETLTQALKEQKDIDAIGSFELVTPIEELLANFAYGQTFNFRAAIDVQPEVTLKNYKGLSVKVEKIEPDLTQADKTLREFQIKHSTLVPVEDRGAQIGDVVTINLIVIDRTTGEEMPDAGAEDLQLDMEVDDFIPELIEGIAGMTVEETKEIDADFPTDFISRDLAGKSVKFVTTLKDLKARELPALDDDFAKTISEKETMAELREYLETRAVEEAEDKTRENTEKAILEALVQEIEADLPTSLVNKEATIMLQQQAMYLQRSAEGARLAKQLFTKELIGEMRRINEPEAIARLKRTLALAEVAKLEKLENTKEEEDKRAAEILQALQGEVVDPQKLAEVVADELLTEKAMEFLKQNAQIEYVAEGELKPEPAAIAETVAEPEAIAETAAASEEVTVEVVTEPAPETPAPEAPASEALASEAEVADKKPPAKTTKKTKKVKA